MLWVMTGYCSHGDGILYVVEAETEEEVYMKVAKIRKLKYVRVDNRVTQPVKPVKTGKGLDDDDEFGGDLWADLLLFSDEVPSFAAVDNGDFDGFACVAVPAETNVNLSDAVQW